jgi:hypothetical protein
MKKKLFLLLSCVILLVLASSCEREMNYLKCNKYYLENATMDDIYVSFSKDSVFSSFYRLEPYDRIDIESFNSYFDIEHESFRLKFKVNSIDYIVDHTMGNGPISLDNYHRDHYLDKSYMINDYNVVVEMANIFSITDEYIESLKKQ